MPQIDSTPGSQTTQHGIEGMQAHWNLSRAVLYEEAIRRREGLLSANGVLVVETGKYTGRSPNDKFIVREETSEKNIAWGEVNRPFEPEKFDSIHQKMLRYLRGREAFIQDCYVGTDPQYRLPIRIITEHAWHSLFARNMFLEIEDSRELEQHRPQFTVIHYPSFHTDPALDGTHSEAFILVNFKKRLVLIGGTEYAGEIKKSVFTVMNYLLPLQGVMAMHCSANVGKEGDPALFFGLSGTGKTSLSADPERDLIGDDEHGWSDEGVFNFEGGCYAKVIKLSPEAEPEIYATTKMFGTILENVVIDPSTRSIDLDDASLTENTRGSYPIESIPNIVPEGRAGHPHNIIMLTADAFGVMPPIARLTPEQAMYHFLSGYTAKVAGTERGIKEPQATFSTCFGAPFMPLQPTVYARLLGEKIRKHKVHCWLVNTGWSGGVYGVGKRVSIVDSRAMVKAALNGSLLNVSTELDPTFGFEVPKECPGISSNHILKPRNTWKDQAAYDAKAKELARRFHENFKQFEAEVPAEIRSGEPTL